jgi:hypothetical protein
LRRDIPSQNGFVSTRIDKAISTMALFVINTGILTRQVIFRPNLLPLCIFTQSWHSIASLLMVAVRYSISLHNGFDAQVSFYLLKFDLSHQSSAIVFMHASLGHSELILTRCLISDTQALIILIAVSTIALLSMFVLLCPPPFDELPTTKAPRLPYSLHSRTKIQQESTRANAGLPLDTWAVTVCVLS